MGRSFWSHRPDCRVEIIARSEPTSAGPQPAATNERQEHPEATVDPHDSAFPKASGSNGGEAQPLSPTNVPFAEWKKNFDSWMAEVQARAQRYPSGFVMDDSRESIYEGCGE
jgi:hypothetical protein